MSLSDFYEGGLPIVEYGGDFFWVGDEDPLEGMKVEECDFEPSEVPAIRRSVGVGTLVEGVHDGSCDGVYDGGRYVNDTGYLSDKGVRLYRKIVNKQSFHPDVSVKPYHVYLLEEDSWFCIRQGCQDCPNQDICEVELVEKPSQLSVVNIDVSSQEPMLNTFLSKEPKWLCIFRNRHLRELGLTHYLDMIMTDTFGVDPDHTAAEWYWVWLDRKFHEDYEPLVLFNRKVDEWRLGLIPDIWDDVNYMVNSMKVFKSGDRQVVL